MSSRTSGGSDRGFRWAAGLIVLGMILAACGDAPLETVGRRSSDWIGEPTIVTTSTVPVTTPIAVTSDILKWFNDSIVNDSLGDPEAVRDAIFDRRGGDLIVQASRAEIGALVPDVKFPAEVPYLAEYVTSQVVFDGTGELSDDPIVGFGLWSSEPYTRSRSVAQMVVIWIARDEEGAAEVSSSGSDLSCARFADGTTTGCSILDIGDTPVWSLTADNGTTLVWFDGVYRYEAFGRDFVPVEALQEMASSLAALPA